jgi:multicomponent Na+:H+ antiporter subunit G
VSAGSRDGLAVTLDAIGTVSIVAGVLLTLVASVGLLSLPDVLSRMHAATKPQVLGLLLVALGGALHLRNSVDVWMLVLVGAFQLVTAPVTAHVVGRLAHRGDGVRRDLLHVDELEDTEELTDLGPDGPEPDEPDAEGPSDPEDTDVPLPPAGRIEGT